MEEMVAKGAKHAQRPWAGKAMSREMLHGWDTRDFSKT